MKILLIHNKVKLLQPISWLLSFPIRVLTCSKWNHVALEIEDSVIESVGKGVIATEKQEWMKKADRVVRPLLIPEDVAISQAAIDEVLGQPYGFLDLIGVLVHIIRTKWMGRPEKIGKDYRGVICSELAVMLLKIKKRYVTPADFEYMGFEQEQEYETRKAK